MPVAEVRTMLAAGNLLLHKTTDASGALQCFSLVTPMSNFLLLAYIATDQTKQSSGVGSKHMKALLALLKKSHATHLGLFLEIESTLEPKLSAAEDSVRKRRLAFYQRLSCQRLSGKDYLLPSYTPGLAARQGELLWFEFGGSAGSDSTLQAVISEIYTRGYNITTSDPSYVKVIGQFAAPQAAPPVSPQVLTQVLPAVPSVVKSEASDTVVVAANGGTPPVETKS
jgi:hypothetical protein